jgi:two-component system, OmpR family, phosphate regulon sensor histidine kinase PhoR
MLQSIRWRIALPFVLLILATMIPLGLYLSHYVRQSHLTELQNNLAGETRLLADALGVILSETPQPRDLDDLARHWAGLLSARVTLVAADGRVIGESHDNRAEMDNHLGRAEILQARQAGFGTSQRYSHTTGYNMLYAAAPVRVEGEIAGYARLALPLTQIEASVAHLQRTLLGATLLAAALAVALAVAIADRTTSPLRRLSRSARALAASQETGSIPPGSRDEVGQLARAFNLRTRQLQEQMDAVQAESVKLGAVLDEMSDGVLMVDGAGRIQLANLASIRMFGLENWTDGTQGLAEAVRQHQVVDLWRSSLASGEPQEAALEIGALRQYLHIHATPLGQALPGSTLLLFQDLTRLRRLETVRRDFISNLSHELRTPLASLKALAETLQEGALEDPPAARRFLGRMEAELDALAQLVSELLELSRIESGKVLLQSRLISPVELVETAVERLRLQAERAGLSLETSCPADLPQVLVDPPRLQQVLANLLHNAVKFTPTGGRVRLEARQEGNSVVFSVSDSGVGIPAEDLPRVFERFYKADRARSGGGTGLGLAIARHLVEAHGGEIWVESREGGGSVFSFRLPAQPGAGLE